MFVIKLVTHIFFILAKQGNSYFVTQVK